MDIALIVACAAAGAAAGWCAFALAQRQDRTRLPGTWRRALSLLTGALCAVMAWAVPGAPALPAFLFLVVAGVVLAAVDVRHQLLPNRLVLPLLAGAAALLGLAGALAGAWLQLLGALLGAAGLFAVYLALALIKAGGLGMGDVKLAAVIGLYAGYLGFRAWLFVLLGAFIINALAILALLLRRAVPRAAKIPFGPSMLAAALLLPLSG